MVIKHASRKDIAALTAVETACFPPAEAATEKEFIDRVQYYGNHFWLLYEGDKLLAFALCKAALYQFFNDGGAGGGSAKPPAFRVRVGVPVPGSLHSREKRRF